MGVILDDETAPPDIVIGFAKLDSNDDGWINGADYGVVQDRSGLAIHFDTILQNLYPPNRVDGLAILKLDGIAALTATDFA